MGICNYCTLKQMKIHAKHQGLRIVIHHIGPKDKENWGMGGLNIHAVPAGEQINQNNKRAWFMALSTRCEC